MIYKKGGIMQKSFTSKAQKALKLAEKASKSMQHNYVGTEKMQGGNLTGFPAGKLEQSIC